MSIPSRFRWIPALLLAVSLCIPLQLHPGLARATADSPVWGIEYSYFNSRILQYNLSTRMQVASCIPPGTNIGAGLAYDPSTGNLWYTTLTYSFEFLYYGDGLIHEVTRPVNGVCQPVKNLTIGQLPAGDPVQNGIGALAMDPTDGNVWAASFWPVFGANGTPGEDFLFKVNKTTGTIMASCWVPDGGNGSFGNVTLAARQMDSHTYLFTNAAGPLNRLMRIDAASCRDARQAPVQTTYTLPVSAVAGIAFNSSGHLLATDSSYIYDLGTAPYGTVLSSTSTNGVVLVGLTAK